METRTALVSAPGSIGVERQAVRERGEDDVIVRVAECGLCGSDLKMYSGKHPKLRPPLVLGHEFYGTRRGGRPGHVSCSRRSAAGECHNCRRGEPHTASDDVRRG